MPPQEILVLAPHPDDETFGCGGTLKLLSDAGALIDVLFLTRGELGTETNIPDTLDLQFALAATRTQEAADACSTLGVRHTYFLNGSDGKLAQQTALVAELCGVLQHSYRRIFCPHAGETHPDHRATFALLRTAARQLALRSEVWLYEVWTPLLANMFVPIDHVIEQKLAAMQCHRSQLAILDYSLAFQGLARYRALFSPPSKFAEAFFVCDADSL